MKFLSIIGFLFSNLLFAENFNQLISKQMATVMNSAELKEKLNAQNTGTIDNLKFEFMGRATFGPAVYTLTLVDRTYTPTKLCLITITLDIRDNKIMKINDCTDENLD